MLGSKYFNDCRDIVARAEALDAHVHDVQNRFGGTLRVAFQSSLVNIIGSEDAVSHPR